MTVGRAIVGPCALHTLAQYHQFTILRQSRCEPGNRSCRSVIANKNSRPCTMKQLLHQRRHDTALLLMSSLLLSSIIRLSGGLYLAYIRRRSCCLAGNFASSFELDRLSVAIFNSTGNGLPKISSHRSLSRGLQPPRIAALYRCKFAKH